MVDELEFIIIVDSFIDDIVLRKLFKVVFYHLNNGSLILEDEMIIL
jgi:hypothetical protein